MKMDKSGSHVLIVSADANKWHTNKVNFVKLYLEGTDRQWVLVRDPRTWEDFKRQFFDAFKQKNFKFRSMTKLRSRRQAPTESVESYFYEMLDLCRPLEVEQNSTMTESQKLEYLLLGLTPILLERLWPLIPQTYSSQLRSNMSRLGRLQIIEIGNPPNTLI